MFLGCLLRPAPVVAEDPLLVPLGEADRVWERRAVDGGPEAALAAYEALLPLAPGDPRLAARLARAHHLRALVAPDPDAALHAYEVTRELGVACLVGDPAVEGALRAARLRWTPAVVAAVPAVRTPCLVWAAAGSVGTVEVRGPGAALELQAARTYAEGATARLPGEPWAARSLAMASLLDPLAKDAERTQAVDRLESASALAPGLDWFVVDLAQARGETPALPPMREADPLRHENEAARRRLTSP